MRCDPLVNARTAAAQQRATLAQLAQSAAARRDDPVRRAARLCVDLLARTVDATAPAAIEAAADREAAR